MIEQPISHLAKLIQQRDISVSELLETFIKQVETVNPKINALVQSNFSKARSFAATADKQLQQSGFSPNPLFGIPFTVKDLYSVPGYIVTSGTEGLAKQVCQNNTTVITRLEKQGAILLGLTNTPEMGVSLETDNLVYGRTNHPLLSDYSSGGSSGGEAALIASHAVPMGIAGDHGGGGRYPAHCCGVTLLRPSLGRLPQTGSLVPKRSWVALSSRITPMANHVEDLATILVAIQGGDGLDPYAERPSPNLDTNPRALRIAYLIDQHYSDYDPAIPQAFEHICDELPQIDITVEKIETALFEEGSQIAKTLFCADAGEGLRGLLDKLNTKNYSPQLQAWLDQQNEKPLTLMEYSALWSRWDEYKIKFLKLFKDYDILIAPVSPQCALPHGATLLKDRVWSLIRYTSTLSLTECPVVVLPVGKNQAGLPIGIQVIAKPWMDELAIDAAKKIEQLIKNRVKS